MRERVGKALAKAWQAVKGPSLKDSYEAELADLAERSKRFRFKVGDRAHKGAGDYVFQGWIVSAFAKRSGVIRYCVENPDGLVHIFNEGQLAPGWWPKGDTEGDIAA